MRDSLNELATLFLKGGGLMKALCLLLLFLTANFAEAQLVGARTVVNAKGVAAADVAVSSSAVSVMDAAATRVAGVIVNSGTADMRCAPDGTTLSATQGFLIVTGARLSLTTEARESWKCIRTTANDTTAGVAEVHR